jgi:XTP/dITP diphosphohydrolase
VVEDGDTFRSNAEKKAAEQAVHLGRWVIGEDSGLCVAALKGAPGIYSARFAGESANDDDNNEKLIRELDGQKDRSANYISHIALSDPKGEILLNVEAKCFGRIVDERRGTSGFGYDPFFEVPEYGLTMAQLGSSVKSIISHRAKAMRKFLRKFLH